MVSPHDSVVCEGYLTRKNTVDGKSTRVMVIRYEDIVLRPEHVVKERALLGLLRNASNF